MDEDIEKEHHRTYTYHFFFNHGLFDEILHVRDFVKELDKYLLNKLDSQDIEQSELLNPGFSPKIQFGFVFPRILWRTSFLNSYFLLESSLNEVCKNIQKAESYVLQPNDISGTGIIRSSIYLQKVCNIKEPFHTEEWRSLTEYNQLRNLLVHSDGVFNSSNKKLIEIIKKHDGALIDIIDNEILSLNVTKRFTLSALDTIEKFFQFLHSKMNDQTN